MEKTWIIFICQTAAIAVVLAASFLARQERAGRFLRRIAFAIATWVMATFVAMKLALMTVLVMASLGLTTFNGNLPLKPFLFIISTVLHFMCMAWLPLKDRESDLSLRGKIVEVEVVAFVLLVGS